VLNRTWSCSFLRSKSIGWKTFPFPCVCVCVCVCARARVCVHECVYCIVQNIKHRLQILWDQNILLCQVCGWILAGYVIALFNSAKQARVQFVWNALQKLHTPISRTLALSSLSSTEGLCTRHSFISRLRVHAWDEHRVSWGLILTVNKFPCLQSLGSLHLSPLSLQGTFCNFHLGVVGWVLQKRSHSLRLRPNCGAVPQSFTEASSWFLVHLW
jgi:hypothetical protein